ncbi:uncharacterized protein LOC132740956 [Ruditapes philippinarum]|uniref:uncharacterized protein LOC132740956 n=1 Tax=Ruditapes philippinarum TaxID=129788 RepID=UPI00295AEEFB|nr:uncharacterized protein LOC132740956 [Ruditapes philippinarum]
MGVVDGFKGAGLFAKIAFGLLLVATLFAWIAYTCTGWGEATSGTNEGRHYGLWRSCSDDKYTPTCIQLDGWANDWYATCQAFVTFGFFGINVGLFLLILYMFVPSCLKNGEIGMAAAIVCIVTGVLYLIGVIVYGAKFDKDYIDPGSNNPTWGDFELGYCFGLSIVALILEIVAGVLIFLDSKKGGTSPSA